MNKIYLIAAACLLAFPMRGQTVDLNEKLPVDGSVRVGKLENGMTYFIKKISTLPTEVSFYRTQCRRHQETRNRTGLLTFWSIWHLTEQKFPRQKYARLPGKSVSVSDIMKRLHFKREPFITFQMFRLSERV